MLKIHESEMSVFEGYRHVMSSAVREAYRAGEEDETLKPLILCDRQGRPVGRIHKGDSLIFYNIRGEREIELTRSLVERGFQEFPVEEELGLSVSTMIEYHKALPVGVAFPPGKRADNTLSDILAAHGLRQAKITEAEKAVHVTFYLNGKKTQPLPGEERIIVPTRKDVALFDEAPEMSIIDVTKAAQEKITDNDCDVVFVNLPNVDVVAHIENEQAVIRAIEVVDKAAGQLVEAAQAAGMMVILTADHGTAEKWFYPDGAVDTGHTDSPVPFVLISNKHDLSLRPEGELADIAPTVLDLLGISCPTAMTGRTLLAGKSFKTIARPRLLFVILDGWGLNEMETGNLIARAKTPVMDRLRQCCPHARLTASGEAVGLPPGTVGNSEVGHLHIGAGRRIWSDRLRIDRAIADGSFFDKDAFLEPIRAVRDTGRFLHLMGIVSFFSSHGSVNHLLALMDLAKREGLRDVFIHAMLGRRGEQPDSGANYIEMIERKTEEIGVGRVVSVIGRYWSMDREENWDRIQKTYRMLIYGEGTPIVERSVS
jgi:2,3-bisphosphoglycerate-independent phosphoglycerate mutase